MALSPISQRPTYRAPPPPESQPFRAKSTPENTPVIPSLDSAGCKARMARQCDAFDQGSFGKNPSQQGAKDLQQTTQQLVEKLTDLVQDLSDALQGAQGAQGAQNQTPQGGAQGSSGAQGNSGSQQTNGVDTRSMQQNLGEQVPELGDKPAASSTKSANGVNPLVAPDQATADAEIQKQYGEWKDKYVTSEGTGGADQLRVKRPENNNDTVSEGIGYGMRMAAQAGDQKTFDGLWNYAKSHMNEHGVMDWKIDANNQVMADGHNGATDADQDMAMALITADKKFGGYQQDTTKLINNIKQHEVEPGTNVLKPGDMFGGSNETNPSYFDPAAYKAFGEYTGDKSWDKVADKSYEILDNIAKQPGFKDTGLVPDWCTAEGTPSANRADAYKYSYDAARTPWRIGADAAQNGDPRATAFLDKMNSFWKQQGGFDNVKAGYDGSGNPTAGYQNSTFTSTAAAGAVTETDAATRAKAWQATVNSKDGGYFGDSLRVLSLMQMGNWMART